MLRSVLIFRRQAFSCQQPSGRFSTAAEREMEKLKKIFIKPDISTNAKVSNEVMASHSLTTANSLDMLKFKIGKHVRKFKAHETDTGSSSIQSKNSCPYLTMYRKLFLIYKGHFL